jgi:hypothetical protein
VREAAVLEAALELVVLEAAVPVLPVVVQAPEAAVPAEAVQVAGPVQVAPEWVAAQAEPLRPARAMARRVPVSVETAPLAALARRVRSVPLPALQV